jgi:hypothetical protein
LTLLGVDLINLTGHLTLGVLVGEKQGFKDAWPYTLTGLFLLGGPIVHLAYGRPAQAGRSLGVRVAVPLAFALIGGLAAPESSGNAVAGAVGMAAAITFDAAVLGRGDYVGVPTGGRLPLTIPWVDHTRRAAGANMAWAF